MRIAYAGWLEEAVSAARVGRLAQSVAEGFRAAYGWLPASEEVSNWEVTLPVALDCALGAVPDSCAVMVEYGLPFNDQRIDLLLIGGRDGKPAAHVMELKRWDSSEEHPRLTSFVRVGTGASPHPSYQVLNYAGKLRHLHSFGSSISVSQSALIADGGPENHRVALGDRFRHLRQLAPLFVAPDTAGLRELLHRELPEPATKQWVRAIAEGRYSQSGRLLELVSEHQSEIRRRAAEVLASAGWGLAPEQLLVHDEILAAIQAEESGVYAVSGGPGSGKSLLALHLFLAAAGLGRKTILAVRNNRLNAALREILSQQVLGSQGMVKYFSTSGRAGVEDDPDGIADVLICDEAQRLALKTTNVFRRAPIVVLLYDETQILNDAEHGTGERFQEACQKLDLAYQSHTLLTPHRCRGGSRYLQWVNTLLQAPSRIGDAPRDWRTEYELKIAGGPQDVVDYLRKLADRSRVGLLASFTRASGRDRPKGPRDLGRIRVPETATPIRWLMDPQTEYVPFWVGGGSNELKSCASIYGCQGFELDYAGLFWGDDLVIRDGRWALGNPDNCYDHAPGAKPLAKVMRETPDSAMMLLKNRYRVLLSRGILGTVIYPEDAETRAFLREVVSA